ncbi:SgcJ/EcaC family oxidoreductase [Caballeronia sp. LZ033]|uniref:YybH family protein n=1 Tax=Caballeronia sp. LZ033 TaxID=3038566 RepID=UPI00285AEC02|nr:SgcJ/EcaC family oxidoreductase [Caballeronia sp. LZ033]MDR5814158.1 SgcJ/EcaC family oxidoreductase [Caballeronia sp. LZ033]
MNECLDTLRRVERAWNEAARNWDPHALTALYAPDALFFGGRKGQSAGARAILAYFSSYCGVIESATLALVEQHVIRLAHDCFLAQGYGEFTFTLAGNRTSRSRLRTTLVIASHDAAWRIRQHHFSTEPDTPPI